MRKPTDKCLLCTNNLATQTNSHIIPAALLKSSIGKRNYEESYKIDTGAGSVDEYFGRYRLDNPTTEIKQNHASRDFYFCPECESKLGVIEGEVAPHLEKMRDEKFHQNYESNLSDGGLKYLKIKRLDSEKFNIFFLSVVWRISLLHFLEKEVRLLNSIDMELHRRIIWYFLYNYKINYAGNSDAFGLIIMTCEQFSDSSKNVNVAYDFIERPKMFWIYEYLVLHYSAHDFALAKLNGNYFNLPPDSALLNFPPERPKITVVPEKFWDEVFLSAIHVRSAKSYIHTLVTSLSKAKGLPYDLCKFLIFTKATQLHNETGSFFADCCTIAEKELRESTLGIR
jgi:hypothetical protein